MLERMISLNINNYIETQYREIYQHLNVEYIELYNSFNSLQLREIFSTLHQLFVTNYKLMNQRLPTGDHGAHFWAVPSRSLVLAINTATGMKRALKNTEYAFVFDDYYDSLIKESEEFLSTSGGSLLPPNMEKVNLYYTIPIILPSNTIKIDSINEQGQIADLKIIGEGSYAKVFSYTDPFYSKKFVLKRAKNDLNDKELKRFEEEFLQMKCLLSPFIVEVYIYNKDKNEYIMEYMDSTLENYISSNNSNLDFNKRKGIAFQILKAFKYIHSKNLLHRDISPNNVLVKLYDDVNVIKISDFGLVKIQDSTLTSLNTELKGCFNDPGLLTYGFSNYSMEHETYALTRLIIFVLTGKINLTNIGNELLASFVKKGLSPDLNKRFHSVDEMEKYIRDILSSYNVG